MKIATSSIKIYVLAAFISFVSWDSNRPLNFEEIPFQETLATTHPFYGSLEIKDTNALIISVYSNSFWFQSVTTSYLIYFPDGSISKMTREVKKDGSGTPIIIKEKVSTQEQGQCNDWLGHCLDKGLFNLNQASLSNTKKPNPNTGKVESIQVSDGVQYRISVILNRRFLRYTASNPETYIEEDYPGKEDRLKFLEIVESFRALTSPDKTP